MVKTLKETLALEAVTETMHSTMLTQAIVKNMELKLVEYEKSQVDMNEQINWLFMENVRLGQQLEGAVPSQVKELLVYQSSKNKKPSVDTISMEQLNTLKQGWDKEIEESKGANEAVRKGVKNQFFDTLENIGP